MWLHPRDNYIWFRRRRILFISFCEGLIILVIQSIKIYWRWVLVCWRVSRCVRVWMWGKLYVFWGLSSFSPIHSIDVPGSLTYCINAILQTTKLVSLIYVIVFSLQNINKSDHDNNNIEYVDCCMYKIKKFYMYICINSRGGEEEEKKLYI